MKLAKAVPIGLVLLVSALAGDAALAFNWTATGSFKYQDREFDINGFTGLTPALPIRFAKVEVRYKQGGGSNLLATGFTDANGNYSVQVLNDTTVRDILVRVITTSGVSDLFLQVTNVQGQTANYAVSTPFFLAHQPNQDLNAGNFTAVLGQGAEAFNVFDVALNSIDYLAFLNGSRPGSTMALKLQWEEFGFVSVNQYIGSNTIKVADNSSFNDTVIQHESGHYAVANFSASDNPGGVHHLTNCKQDLRLAFDEGHATYFGQSVRRHFNLPRPQLYVKMNGAPGPGNLDFYFDVEDEQPFSCTGSSSEVTVYAALWDIGDSAGTADDSPGLDEAWDPLGSADAQVWDVMRNYLPSASNKSMEDFWDGWFVRSEGLSSGMILGLPAAWAGIRARRLGTQRGVHRRQAGGLQRDSPARQLLQGPGERCRHGGHRLFQVRCLRGSVLHHRDDASDRRRQHVAGPVRHRRHQRHVLQRRP